MIPIDSLSFRSGLREVNVGEKAAFAGISLILCVAGRSILASAYVAAVMGAVTVRWGGVPAKMYLRLLAIPFGFLMMNALVMGFVVSRTPMEAVAVPVGGWYLTAGRETLFYALRMWAAAMAGVSCLYFLACTTPAGDLLAFLERLGLPGLILQLTALIYRFIFLLLDRAYAMDRAQKSRLGNRDYRTALKSFGAMAASLLAGSMHRSKALYDAMEARCYEGSLHLLALRRPVKWQRAVGIAVFELLLCLILLAERRSGWGM